MRVIIFAALALLATFPARAEQPCALQRIAAVPFETSSEGLPIIPALLAGRPARLLVASGGDSLMDTHLANELQLSGRTGYFYGYTQKYVRLRGLTLGSVTFNQRLLFHLADIGSTQFGATLGANFFVSMDVEIDNSAKTISFFSPNHCKGAGVYWTNEAATLPIVKGIEGAPIVEAELQGERVTAMFDTGSPTSAMTLNVANRKFGLTPKTPGVTQLRAPSGALLDQYMYTFGSLTLSGVHFENVPVLILPIDAPWGPDLTLGMNELRHLRLYFSLKDRMVHITAANAGRDS